MANRNRLTLIAGILVIALVAAYLAPSWYMHNLTTRYERANGPLWTAEVQKAWGNVLDPLWEANHGDIQRLGEALGLSSESALRLPMAVRHLSARLTDETVDSNDAVSSTPDVIPFVYGAPPSLLVRMRKKDSYLDSPAGRRLLATMATFSDRKTLDDTYYDSAPRTPQSQFENNPYAHDGFRTYSFFALIRYAIMRYEYGDSEARLWYMNQLCADDGKDWRYDRKQAQVALLAAGYVPPPCIGHGLQAHVEGFRSPPTFSEIVAKNPQLPELLWGEAAKRFGLDVFATVLFLMLAITWPVWWMALRTQGNGNRLPAKSESRRSERY